VTPAQIESAVLTALGNHTLDEVRTIATLDTKADNPALATFCERHRIALITFSVSAIEACFDAHPTLHRSPAARQHVGVDGICEPCALLAAPGGNLLAGRYARNGVTVAIAAMAQTHRAHNE
jgi:cobalamin biosynthesis protein CbiG